MIRLINAEYKWRPNKEPFTFWHDYDKYLKEKKINWSKIDTLILIIFMILSYYTRFRNINFPSITFFDESYFGNFTNYYYDKNYFIDIYQPLGKMILYAGAVAFGYKRNRTFSPQGNLTGC